MEDCIKDLRRAGRQIEREDSGTKISAGNFVRQMLRRSGLTPQEQGQVRSAAGAEWDPTKIEEALKLMYQDVTLDDAWRLHHIPKKFNRFKTRPSKGRGEGKDKTPSKISYEDAEDPDDESDQEDADSDEDDPEEAGANAVDEDEDEDEDEDTEDGEVEELVDAYFTGQQARNKLKKFGFMKKTKPVTEFKYRPAQEELKVQ